MSDNAPAGASPESAGAAAPPAAAHQEFLKKHVRGIPKEKLAEKRMYYGFKYKDLKAFIESIVAQCQGVDKPELVAKISELEMALQALRGQKAEADARAQEAAAALEKTKTDAQAARSEAEQAAAGREADAEAAGKADADAVKALEERIAELEAEKAGLQAHSDELEKGLSGAGDAAKRAADLAAELAALQEVHAKLEQENEFMDGEMTKLDETAKRLAAELDRAKADAQALREAAEKAASQFDGERSSMLEKTMRLEKIVSTSGDAKKLLEMQKQFETYAAAFRALEAGAEEMVDLERRPEPKALDSGVQALRGRLAQGTPAAALLGLLEQRLAAARKEIEERIREMNAYRGSVRIIVDLEKAVVREQEIARAIDILGQTAGK